MDRTDKQIIILVKYSSLAALNTRIMWAYTAHWLCSASPKHSVQTNVKPWFGDLVLQEPWIGWGSVSEFSIATLVCWGRKCSNSRGKCGEEPRGEGVNVAVPWPHTARFPYLQGRVESLNTWGWRYLAQPCWIFSHTRHNQVLGENERGNPLQ